MADARRAARTRRSAGRRDRARARIRRARARTRLAGRRRDRADPVALLDGDRVAVAHREGPAQDGSGRALVRGAAVPGHRGDPDARGVAAARDRGADGRRPGRRARRLLRRAAAGLGARARHHRRGGGDRRRGAVPGAPALPLHRAQRSPRGVHRGGAADRRRDRARDAERRTQPGTRHLPRRRGAGEQRIPPPARERRRAVQGSAARSLLHRGRRFDRLRAGRRARGRRHRAGAGTRRGEVRGAVRARPRDADEPRPGPALRVRTRAGR